MANTYTCDLTALAATGANLVATFTLTNIASGVPEPVQLALGGQVDKSWFTYQANQLIAARVQRDATLAAAQALLTAAGGTLRLATG